jgi:hypothetical protein
MGAEASVANRATLKNLPSLVFMIRRELVLLLKTVQQSLYSHRNTPPYFAKWNLSKFHKISLILLSRTVLHLDLMIFPSIFRGTTP